MGHAVFLGIDTSNYTTSVAAVSGEDNILVNSRKLLEVAEGEKGLRQSDALFQHWKVLPQLIGPVLKEYRDCIKGVCCSSRPRPVDGSYMPVFTAGVNMGRTVADALGAEYSEISHQEGHFIAAAYGNELDISEPMICAHLSGGTLELILKDGDKYELIGGTKDISYGQLLDRVGVDLGYPFPAGKFIDEKALEFTEGYGSIAACVSSDASERLQNALCRVFTDKTYLNLSGLETRAKQAENLLDTSEICFGMMLGISESFTKIVESAMKEYRAEQVLISGGVACSSFLRRYCDEQCQKKGLRRFSFGRPDMCSDNACGAALHARSVSECR